VYVCVVERPQTKKKTFLKRPSKQIGGLSYNFPLRILYVEFYIFVAMTVPSWHEITWKS